MKGILENFGAVQGLKGVDLILAQFIAVPDPPLLSSRRGFSFVAIPFSSYGS
jgi:hypothetical protein